MINFDDLLNQAKEKQGGINFDNVMEQAKKKTVQPVKASVSPKALPRYSKAGEETTLSYQPTAEDKTMGKILPRAVGAGLASGGLNVARAIPSTVAASLADGGTSKRYEESNKYIPKPVDAKQMELANKIANIAKNISYPGTKIDTFISDTQKDVGELQGTGNKIFAQALMAGGQMAPAIATGLVAGPAIGMSAFGSQVYGGAFKEALDRGADTKTAGDYALGQTLLEVGTEILAGGIPGLGKGLISKLASSAGAKNLAAKAGIDATGKLLGRATNALFASRTGKVLFNALGEGGEEVIAEYLSPFIERATIDPNAPDATVNQIAEAFAIGGLMSFLLQGGGIRLSDGRTVQAEDVQTLNKSELNEVEDELYRLARESNIRKGKITPQGETIEGWSAETMANERGLPEPIKKSVSSPNLKQTDIDYRGRHLAPFEMEDNAPAYDLTQIYPQNVYSKDGAKIYGTNTKSEQKALSILTKIKGNPEADVTVYRAVPQNAAERINSGDWVSLTEEYAKEHGQHTLNDSYKIISTTTKAKNLVSEGNSLNEFGYVAGTNSQLVNAKLPLPIGSMTKPKTAYEQAAGQREMPFSVFPGEAQTLPVAQRPLPQAAQTIPQVKQVAQPTLEPLNRPVQARTADLRTLVAGVAPQIKDISARSGRRNDIWEVFRMAFGKNAAALKKAVLDPFAKDKGNAARYQIEKANTLKTEMKRLGIKKGSRESIAVREFGEGMRIVKRKVANLETGKQQEQYIEEPYTLRDLQKEFPNNWQNIVEADKWFRKEYDEFIDRINAVKSIIYPNADANFDEYEARIQRVQNGEGKYTNYSAQEKSDAIKRLRSEQDRYITGKRIPKREDYYRHFTELTKGFAGLWNIIDSPAQIGSHLQGISEYTKPKSRWESFAQHRKGDYTEADAISGYLNYMPGAAYAIYIDPHIAKFRELADALADTTEQTNNAGNLILTLRHYADSLAGKTSPQDRALLESIPGGRKGLRALNWLNNRVKANVILFNMGATVSQLANIPAGIATIKNPVSLARGMYHTLVKNPAIKMSDYMTERLMGDITDQFNESLLHKPMEFAKWLISAGDAVGSRFIWYSAYENALAKGSENPALEADDMTRMLTAGRGIGEVPLNQRDSITKLIAPFTVEVQNMWRIQKRFVNEKDFGGLLLFWVLSFLFNEGTEEIRGTRILFDPIDAMRDALTEEDLSPLERGGRLAGEYLSNVPFGQTFAALYPEYGLQPMEGVKLPTREKLFGDTDPTRFGTGILAQQAITDPIFKILPPAGGAQIKKTYDFLKSAQVLPVVNPLSDNFGKKQDIKATQKNGKIKFGLGDSAETMVKGSLFGSYATDEGKEYIESDLNPIGEKNSAVATSLAKAGVDDVEAVNLARKLPNLKVNAARETIMNSNLTAKQKNIAGALVNSDLKVDYSNRGTYEFSLLPKETRRKYLTVSQYGVSKEDFIYVMENKDADRNGGVKKDEAIKVLDSMNFTRKQKALMWPLISTAKNPYQ